ncbi:MAG TPA: trypsin-like peptidase domain-containing protein, partial [Planctomycetota bacterium]
LLLACGASALPAAQGRAGRAQLLPLEQVALVELAPLELEAVLKEDLAREAEALPPRFAVPHEARLAPHSAGTWESLDAGTLLWRLRVRSLGARSLNLGFEQFRLPEGARLHLYSADREHVVRPFTAADNESHGEMWTPVVATDELVLELVLPAAALDEALLELTWINVGYRGFAPASSTALLSGSCNVDVVCAQGIPWALEIPSVGVISTGGSTFCTGFLVNNVRQDLKPYFMTANHCGVGSGNAASLVVYWNYENSTCRVPGSPASGGAGDGSLTQFNTGSFFRSSYAPSDFTLVELDDAINPAFDVSYAGWNATGTTGSAAVAIHHPNTDEKRISFEDQPTTTTSYLSNTVPGDGTHVRVEDWDLGTTEPGSSGSPLFDPNHRVIGQLHGGFASCTSQTSDWYGKLSVSWTGGGTNATRLRNWLDPDSTGTLVLDTVSLDTLCSDAGTIVLDRGRYACSATLGVTVVDCDLNTNASTAQTVVVSVASSSEPGGESLLLTETGPNTSRFQGSLASATSDAGGVLWVTAGDGLTATYVDADDGMGGFDVPVADTAVVDCTPPGVLAVQFTNVQATSVRLVVSTDEPVVVEALYGFACAATTQSRASEGLATTVNLDLTGLLPDTTYFVKVRALDEAGNETLDTNGGLCHSVTTADVPSFFTEEFLGDNDLDLTTIVLIPTLDGDRYALCRRPASAFPTDPAGGTAIPLSDDGSALVSLSGGKTVKLYGMSHSSFQVNANGNLTFGSADGTYTESLSQHFTLRRVAALFDDLNPAAGGSVSRKQLADRVAVTWQNVPEYSTTNQNSFQIELFFDGRIRITYLAVAATDGIAGLSEGLGLSPFFVETNLSGAQECAARPPLPSGAPGDAGSREL